MPQTRRQIIDQALALSREMLALASDNDWDALTAAAARRQSVMAAGFAAPIPESLRTYSIEAIEHIQHYDKQISALVESNRDQTQKTLTEFHRGQKAARSYGLQEKKTST